MLCGESFNETLPLIIRYFVILPRNKQQITMKRIFILIAMCLPMIAMAQNTWEQPEVTSVNPDQKYLVGAVPVIDGRVTFEKTIEAPEKKAKEIYNIALRYLTQMTTEANQFEQSRIVMNDSVKHMVGGHYQEWLVFKNKPLVLDRTRLFYNLTVKCDDGKAVVTLTRIYYLYDEERTAQRYKAEEWITDEYGLKKNKQKLSRVTGKFRRKTIDRKDYIFNKIESLLK